MSFIQSIRRIKLTCTVKYSAILYLKYKINILNILKREREYNFISRHFIFKIYRYAHLVYFKFYCEWCAFLFNYMFRNVESKRPQFIQKLLLYSRARKLCSTCELWDYTFSEILKITLIGSDKGKLRLIIPPLFLNDDHEGRMMKQWLCDRMKSTYWNHGLGSEI